MYKLDQNLIIARTNSVVVMRLADDDLELVYEIPVSEQIVNILAVPTLPFIDLEPVKAPVG